MFQLFSAPDQKIALAYLSDRLIGYFAPADRNPPMKLASAIAELDILSRPGHIYVTASFTPPHSKYDYGDPNFVWPVNKVAAIPDAIPSLSATIKMLIELCPDVMILCDVSTWRASGHHADWVLETLKKTNHFICEDCVIYSLNIAQNSDADLEDFLDTSWHAWLFGAVISNSKENFKRSRGKISYSKLLSVSHDVIALFTAAYDDEGVMIWVDDRINFHPENLPIAV